MTDEQNPYIGTAEDFALAGLWDEAPYNFRVDSMTPQKKEVQNDNPKTGSKAGDIYHVITGRLIAFERAIYDEDGVFEGAEELDPEQSRFQDFAVQGRGLAQLKSLYRAVTGRLPAGTLNDETGRYDIDFLALGEEMIGATAWNRVFHGKANEETGAIYDKLTYNFTNKPPNKYYAKKKEEVKTD